MAPYAFFFLFSFFPLNCLSSVCLSQKRIESKWDEKGADGFKVLADNIPPAHLLPGLAPLAL